MCAENKGRNLSKFRDKKNQKGAEVIAPNNQLAMRTPFIIEKGGVS